MDRRIAGLLGIAVMASVAGCYRSVEAYRAPGRLAAGARVALLPPRITIEEDDQTLPPAAAQPHALAFHRGLMRTLIDEDPTATLLKASGPAATQVAQRMGGWLAAQEICAGGSYDLRAHLPDATALADELDAGALAFIDARVHHTSAARTTGQVVLGSVAGIGAVLLTTVALVAAVEDPETALSILLLPFYLAPQPDAHAHVAAAIIYSTASGDGSPGSGAPPPPACDVSIQLAAQHSHGFWTGSHLDLTVGVMGRDGRLLWYRSGQLPLIDDPTLPAPTITEFLRGSPLEIPRGAASNS